MSEEDNVALDQKLTEISASGNIVTQSVFSHVYQDGKISQTLLMLAIRTNNMTALDVLLDQPVECL